MGSSGLSTVLAVIRLKARGRAGRPVIARRMVGPGTVLSSCPAKAAPPAAAAASVGHSRQGSGSAAARSRSRARARPALRRRRSPTLIAGGEFDLARTERHHAAEHLDEEARQRQVRPIRIRGHVEEHDPALALARSGDERGAVGQPRPDLRVRWRRWDRRAPAGSPSRRPARRARGMGSAPRRAPSGCGVLQDSDPPRERPPRRKATGSSSSPPCSSRGPAKRMSTPPDLSQSSSSSSVPATSLPISASTMVETLSSISSCTALATLASFGVTTSA